MRIDLHAHSTCSDGTDTPAGLVEAARVAGLDVVAITDHDSTAGWAEAARAATRTGVQLVRGTEISTHAAGRSVHLLCYLQDPTHPGLVEEFATIRDARLTRARRMVDLIAADYALTWDDVVRQTGDGATVGRPHVADALVAAGVVASRDEAFAEILTPRSPYYVPHYAPATTAAIGLVLEAGGVPVLAHPGAASRGLTIGDDVVAELAEAGLVGLETEHLDHTPEATAHLQALAADLGLVATGASDYHGTGKVNRLGARTTTTDALAAIEERGSTPVVR
ncbi:hypothetical protein SAMN04489860_2326 [Paraoerskovia marina]|uniref:Polymerase/histidinol phosphatase N-terminal domain-containing protein n=1 Tax=Paraoerskovia marina TaxID=545619 RepID=A0A1H1UXM2_9CELL|nr:PHP domain-containing protein [Paraoerskovia marina]SDS77100.1 hypothetical protein SAMN04489860_2326 [Paraoerskovia marina]